MQQIRPYPVIALMLLALLLFHLAAQETWLWLTNDLRAGDWACGLARGIDTQGASALIGIEGRLLWAASLILLLVSMGLLLSAGAYSTLQRLPRRRFPAATLTTLALLALLAWLAVDNPADHRRFMQLAEGQACGFGAKAEFHFSRYLLLIFQPYYLPRTLDLLSYAETLLPSLLLLANLFLLLGLLALVWPGATPAVSLQVLAARVARYRLLLLFASALFTAIALYHMSEFSWFAQVLAASDGEGAAQVRGIQRGVTLYLGLINSLALALFFLPTGWLLWCQTLALYEQNQALATPQARDDWLALHGLKLFSGRLAEAGALFAPLLVSGGMTLLQQALQGG